MDNKFLAKLQDQAEENPLVAIGVGVAMASAATQLIRTATDIWGRKTWSKEVARRTKLR